MPTISLIAAVAENYVIGKDGDLPWRLPADLRWFVRHTRGKPVVFGRRTFESTGYLKGRHNIVVTRQADWDGGADQVVGSPAEATAEIGDEVEVMILGGSGIYEEFLDTADRFYLTVVHTLAEGDTKFPPFDADQWEVTYEENRPPDDENLLPMTFFILERIAYGPAPDAPDELLPGRFR